MGLKDEVYAAIREDFERSGGASFLVDYLKREKERRLEKYRTQPDREKKPDAYMRLLFCYRNIRGGGDSAGKARYLQELASQLARNPKLNLGGRAQRILEERTGMDGVFKGERRNMKKYEQMLSRLSAEPPEFDMAQLEELQQDVSFRLLALESKALLYDAIDAGKTADGEANPASSGRRPKVDRMLDLFCDYLRWQGISTLSDAAAGSGGSGTAADDTTEDWSRLYAILNSDDEKKARRVMLPVRVDPQTGASIYIVGRNRFSGSKTVRKKAKGCACCCVGFYPNSMVIEDGSEKDGTWPGIHCAWEEYDETLEDMIFPDIHEALTWYERVLRPHARQSFREENGKAPEGCPEGLKTYFTAF